MIPVTRLLIPRAWVQIPVKPSCAVGFRQNASHTSLSLPMPSHWRRNRPINVNHYANKKSAAESMLDIALLMANASQLKAVIEQGPSFAFFMPLVVLISISLVLQIGVGVLLIFLVRYDLNNPAKHAKLDFLNNLATGLVFIIVVVNIFITAFGVQKPGVDAAPRQ
ncbi:ninjurin-1 isoform X8 [Manis pentadactyla]|uniref:ninjurin-1 isoform X8 n=1 Tax=Manis pentadactyla TaxID=143292 RepID=UPI001874918C|nr:ninjurin-1 isoform X8 [Manis pentadactyla]